MVLSVFTNTNGMDVKVFKPMLRCLQQADDVKILSASHTNGSHLCEKHLHLEEET